MLIRKSTKNHRGYSLGNQVKLIRGGKEYFQLLHEMIEKAQDTIHLQVYIFLADETGGYIADGLIAAARRNVKVYLLADGYASQKLPGSFIQKLREAGINFRFFAPLLKSKYYYFGRRLHHKVVVVDTKYALVGGMNISNNYNDMPGHPGWFDFALWVEGNIARELCVLCWKTWNGYPSHMGLTPCELKSPSFDFKPEESYMIRMRRNDWVRRRIQISKSYEQIFNEAENEIIIVSSYFLPGKRFRKLIATAVERGVKVKIVLANISDVAIAKQAERYMYRWLLKNDIEIYEYRPSVLHAKMAICDNKWLTIGSYNVNNISAFASIELNLDVCNEKFTTIVKQMIEKIIEIDCIPVTKNEFRLKNHFFQKLWQDVCYESIRFLFYLFTFYFEQKE